MCRLLLHARQLCIFFGDLVAYFGPRFFEILDRGLVDADFLEIPDRLVGDILCLLQYLARLLVCLAQYFVLLCVEAFLLLFQFRF